MKFIDSLKAIKADVINELFNINTSVIKMEKIEDKTILDFLATQSKPFKEIFSLDLKSFGKTFNLNPKSKEVETFKKLKYENSFITMNSGKDHIFLVENILYYFRLAKADDGSFSITFGELTKEDALAGTIRSQDFQANKIMSSNKENASQLFGKIRSIIKAIIPNPETQVFSFAVVFSDTYGNIKKLFIDSSVVMFNFFKKNHSDYDKKRTADAQKIYKEFKPAIKNKVDNLMSSIINGLTDISKDSKKEMNSFIKALLSQQSNISLPSDRIQKELIKSKFDKYSFSNLFEAKANEFLLKNSTRYRLYKIIINQLLGRKAIIKSKDGITYFSLSSSSLNKIGN